MNREKLVGSFREDFKGLYQEGIYLGFTWTKIVKREVILKNQLFFIKERYFEDIPWSFSLTKYIGTYAIYQNCFYMYRRERKGAISSAVTKKNQVSLFKNLSEIFQQISEIQKKNLLQGLESYVNDIYQYSIKCYDLLSDDDKKAFYEEKNEISKKWIEIKTAYF